MTTFLGPLGGPLGGPLAGLRFSLVGPGRVGASLAGWAVAAGARCVAVAGRDESAVQALASHLGGRAATLATLEPDNPAADRGADLLLLAVPDRALDTVVRGLADLAGPNSARVVLHTSGSQTAAVLAPLSARGAATGSLHPLRAFEEAATDLSAARDTFFALDGDPDAEALARRLVAAWGGTAAVVPSELRLLYHFAATLAAGGVATVLAAVSELAAELALPPAALAGYRRLARSAIDAADRAARPADAITGPLARGDVALVRSQLAALEARSPELSPLSIALARETLRQLAPVRTPSADVQELAADLARDPVRDRSRDRS